MKFVPTSRRLAFIYFILSISVYSYAQQQAFTTAGTHTFTPHPSVIELSIEALGGGGAGGRVTNGTVFNHRVGGGGGGAGYIFSYVPVVGGTPYNVVVGAGGFNNTNGTEAHGGDTYFGSGTDALAKGGNTKLGNGTNNSPGALGAAATACNIRDLTGTTATAKRFGGGNGGTGDDGPVNGGGGGGAAGSLGNGNNGQNFNNPIGGIRGLGDFLNLASPGNGGNGGVNGAIGGGGSTYGGGGGGSSAQSSTSRPGGPGAGGIAVIYWSRIDALTPASACSGFTGTITITGFNFSTTSPNGDPVVTTSVTFDGNPVTFNVISNTEITFDLPPGATSGNVIVTTTYGRAQHLFVMNTTSTAPTSITANNVCLGNSVTLTANGGSMGTGAQYYWYSGSCGGTLLATTANNTYTFTPNTAGTTDYFVRLAGACDTTTCASTSVTVFDAATMNTINNQTFCAGSVTPVITTTSVNPATTYSWTNSNTAIGLAAAGTGNIPSFTASNPGQMPITASITVTPTANACPGTPQIFTITVNPSPTVDLVANQTLCNGSASSPVLFSGSVAGTVFGWTNDNPSIGLGAVGTGGIPTFTAVNTTNAPVTATITVLPVANGCTGALVTFTYTVNPGPVMNPVSNQSVCHSTASPAIPFSSPVAGTTYTWTNDNPAIGLAASGTGNLPSFTAVNTSSLPITATITVTPAAAGCIGNPITFTITVNPSPVPSFTASPIVCANEQIQFNNNSTNAVSYLWEFGDGNTSTDENPFHEYANLASTYTVTLTVTHANGCTQSLQQSVQTLPNPTAGFTASPTEASVLNGVINFTNTSQGENSWSWDFGNGGTSSSENPSHTYTSPGTYTVVLTVSNIHLCTDTISLQITIFDEIQVPNVFTPNGDGVNDTFSFPAHTAQNVEITILNRWGNVVFKGNDPASGWDGKSNGQNSPDGVYYYLVRVKTADGTVKDHTGSLTLAR